MNQYSGGYKTRMMRLLAERGPTKSICPSEILPPHLKRSKAAMQNVRRAAEKLRQDGKIEILRGGRPVAVESKGPIRLALAKRRIS